MSIVSEISTDLVFSLYQSTDQFPVVFDEAWKWLGFSKKENAKASLLNCGFVLGKDLLINQESLNHEGLSYQEQGAKSRLENIFLTVDCFKTWAMMANTAKGKTVREYFLDCEKKLKQLMLQPQSQTNSQAISELSASIDIFNLSFHTISKLIEVRHFRRHPELILRNNLAFCKALDGLNSLLLEIPEDVITYLWAKFCIDLNIHQKSLESDDPFIVAISRNAIKEQPKIVAKSKYIKAALKFQNELNNRPMLELMEKKQELLCEARRNNKQIDPSLLAQVNKLLSDCYSSLDSDNGISYYPD